MASRLVVGKIFKTSDTPWANAPVRFERVNASYTANKQYPGDTVIAIANESGDISARLWCNEEGEIASEYECFIPGRESFRFTVPLGTQPIEISLLREGGITPASPQYTTLLTYVDQKIAAATGQATYYKEFVVTANQRVFDLVNTSILPQKSLLFINGGKQRFGVDYTINGTVLNWLGFTLQLNWLLEIYY